MQSAERRRCGEREVWSWLARRREREGERERSGAPSPHLEETEETQATAGDAEELDNDSDNGVERDSEGDSEGGSEDDGGEGREEEEREVRRERETADEAEEEENGERPTKKEDVTDTGEGGGDDKAQVRPRDGDPPSTEADSLMASVPRNSRMPSSLQTFWWRAQAPETVSGHRSAEFFEKRGVCVFACPRLSAFILTRATWPQYAA